MDHSNYNVLDSQSYPLLFISLRWQWYTIAGPEEAILKWLGNNCYRRAKRAKNFALLIIHEAFVSLFGTLALFTASFRMSRRQNFSDVHCGPWERDHEFYCTLSFVALAVRVRDCWMHPFLHLHPSSCKTHGICMPSQHFLPISSSQISPHLCAGLVVIEPSKLLKPLSLEWAIDNFGFSKLTLWKGKV